jgi:acetolactate synthase-1/2/3 large subunit
VHIHASAEELNRVYQADLAINATMNAAARSLEVLTAPPNCPGPNGRPAPTPTTRPTSWFRRSCRATSTCRPSSALLQKHLPADAVLTNGAGNFASWTHRFFKHHGLAKGTRRSWRRPMGAMGYGVPAGIAANAPDRPPWRSPSPATATS